MFLVAGESLIDLVAASDGSYRPVAGGAPFNFACALALQGISTAYLNAISEDRFGSLLYETLIAAGASHLGERTARPTSLALVSTTADGQPEYAFYRDGVADREFRPAGLVPAACPTVEAFHSGGLALVPPDDALATAAMRAMRARGALCTLDVNLRPQVAGSQHVDPQRYREAVFGAIEQAHIVKVSDQDLIHLGLRGAPVRVAHTLLDRGCSLVVLTLGSEGAYVLSRSGEWFQEAARVQVVDTVGAGDTFFAGFVAWLQRAGRLDLAISGHLAAPDLTQALRHGTAAAAINIGRRGCQPPTWDEVVAFPAL